MEQSAELTTGRPFEKHYAIRFPVFINELSDALASATGD